MKDELNKTYLKNDIEKSKTNISNIKTELKFIIKEKRIPTRRRKIGYIT